MNYEKLDNEQKELVKYWIEKYTKDVVKYYRIPENDFIEKHLTPETVIEVGKWYKSTNPDKKTLFILERVDVCIDGRINSSYGYGFDFMGRWTKKGSFDVNASYAQNFTEATPEEVNDRIAEEAIRMGFVKGVKITNTGINSSMDDKEVCNIPISGIFKFFADANILDTLEGHGHVFDSGDWAEIIDDKAELKATIAKLRSELTVLESQL